MRILVVEDDTRVARAVKRGLEAEGYAVDVAATGEDGHWLATENDYDALVLDVLLPGPGGLDLCRRLREAGDWTPVLVLTGSTTRPTRHAPSTGAPTTSSASRSRTWCWRPGCGHCSGGGRTRPVELAAGDLRMDPARHRVWRGETPVELTPRQFALLEFFLRRPGEVLSKATILEHVWDFAFDGAPTSKSTAPRPHSKALVTPAVSSTPMAIPSIGMRSPRERNASASIAKMPPNQTHTKRHDC